jgi:hypothetical protein
MGRLDTGPDSTASVLAFVFMMTMGGGVILVVVQMLGNSDRADQLESEMKEIEFEADVADLECRREIAALKQIALVDEPLKSCLHVDACGGVTMIGSTIAVHQNNDMIMFDAVVAVDGAIVDLKIHPDAGNPTR